MLLVRLRSCFAISQQVTLLTAAMARAQVGSLGVVDFVALSCHCFLVMACCIVGLHVAGLAFGSRRVVGHIM